MTIAVRIWFSDDEKKPEEDPGDDDHHHVEQFIIIPFILDIMSMFVR